MDPLSAAASATKLFLLIRPLYPAWEILSLRHTRKNYVILRQKFGMLQALVLMAILPDAKHIVDRVEKHILMANTQEAMALRKSTTEDCTMLAVAAAIVAQVAITALSLENLSKVHWAAEAAFVLSLTAGGLSVFYACLVQQRMSSLLNYDDVKDFFSKPSSSEELARLEQNLQQLVSNIQNLRSSDETTSVHQSIMELESMILEFKNKNRWKSASFHSILLVKAPTVLLKYALASFIIGLGVYFGCLAFSENGSRSQGSYLAIFIVYIATSLSSLLIYFVPFILKKLELWPARRYAQIINHELATHPSSEDEMKIMQKISALLDSVELSPQREDQNDSVA